jgi:glutamate/tyrosine decarboxylase-like PLP-dependent enzyme
VDALMDCANYITTALKQRPGFKLVLEPEFINVCFWYVPPSLQGLQEQPNFNEKLHEVCKEQL